MERRSPGPALSNHSASGREQEAVREPPSQRAPRCRGRLTETGGWVVCSNCSQSLTAEFWEVSRLFMGRVQYFFFYGFIIITVFFYSLLSFSDGIT